MGDMKRQHLISLIFLAAMGIWIGGGLAVCGFTGLGGGIPPSVVVEKAAPEGGINLDEHHQDRYLDWRASPRPRLPRALP